MAHFEVAIVLIISFLIFSQELGDIFVRLQVFILKFLQPPLCMFDIKLFQSHSQINYSYIKITSI